MSLENTTESPDIHVSNIIYLLRTKIEFIHEDGIITTHETLFNEIIHLVTQEGCVALLDLSRILGYKTDISFIVTNKITESKLTLISGKLFSNAHILKTQGQVFSDIEREGCLDLFKYSEKIDIPFELLSNVMKSSRFNIESHLAYTSAYFSNVLLLIIERLNSLDGPIQISIMMGELEIHSCLWESTYLPNNIRTYPNL
jgi:hypothetical protein